MSSTARYDEGGHDMPPLAQPSSQPDHGDVFLLLSLPQDFIVGHDDMAVTTNESLLGFRDIPAGTHFLWVQQPGATSRNGYWYVTQEQNGRVHVKQWDKYNEVLSSVPSLAEERHQAENLESIYPKLKPYDMRGASNRTPAKTSQPLPFSIGGRNELSFTTDPAKMWQQLTHAISEPFLARITGKKSVDAWLVDSADCAAGESYRTQYKSVQSSEFNFLFAQDFKDLKLLDSDPTRRDVVEDTTDRVLALLRITDFSFDPYEIIAELQFTFLTGTHLGNQACMEQWWDLVLKIIMRAYRLVLFYPVLTVELIRTLHAQVIYTEEYIESTSEEEQEKGRSEHTIGPSPDRPIYQFNLQCRRRLRTALATYARKLEEVLNGLGDAVTIEQSTARAIFAELEAWLFTRGWDLVSKNAKVEETKRQDEIGEDDDGDDDMPVVVDLDEHGREVGLVSFND
ncbi:AAR2 protein-domain-containing protein [Pseudoneurospora amorphoporcata]|uniref:AAR2 protein-domain-containing protein n=1 Tax=Pseudoneurospora amorphoporcata TaxID=241081 RepID=A0AAN6SKZ2_9PEZI|nr:AAR2 protein-domain-containing protein [Pseudoneurospora amorphoporcata]